MLDHEFIDCIKQIEGYYAKPFNEYQKDYLRRKVMQELHPTNREVAKAMDILFEQHKRFLPKPGEICDAILSARRDIGSTGTVMAECDRCEGNPGWLMFRNKNGHEPYRQAVPCGCLNTPRWVAENTRSYKDMIADGDASLESFQSYSGRYLYETIDAKAVRDQEEMVLIRERCKVIPDNWRGEKKDNRKINHKAKPTQIGDIFNGGDAPF